MLFPRLGERMNQDSSSYIEYHLKLREKWLRDCALRETSARPSLEIYCKSCRAEAPHEYQKEELDVGLKAGFVCLSCDDGFQTYEEVFFYEGY